MALRKLYLICAEPDCGAEVDAVEYDDTADSVAVVEVMRALDMGEDEARKLVAKRNPGAELRSADAGKALADAIVAKAVADRDPSTYQCRRGHTGALATTDVRPVPAEVFAIVQTPANPAGSTDRNGDSR